MPDGVTNTCELRSFQIDFIHILSCCYFLRLKVPISFQLYPSLHISNICFQCFLVNQAIPIMSLTEVFFLLPFYLWYTQRKYPCLLVNGAVLLVNHQVSVARKGSDRQFSDVLCQDVLADRNISPFVPTTSFFLLSSPVPPPQHAFVPRNHQYPGIRCLSAVQDCVIDLYKRPVKLEIRYVLKVKLGTIAVAHYLL